MLEPVRAALAEALRSATRERFGAAVEKVALERPPRIALGDLACPVAFDLAKTLKKAPRAIAAELADALQKNLPAGVREVRVEGAGYLNFFLERGPIVRALLGAWAPAPARGEKIIVEHTNINPNKAAHIGHLRNAVLGDVLVRSLRRLGFPVEVQNYLDDTGVQVADVVAGLVHLSGVRTAAAAEEVVRERRLPGGPVYPKGFAYLCWDLYAEVGRTYAARPETKAWRDEVLHAIEAGDNEIARTASLVVEAIVSAHLATMGRLGIAYDVLPRESDILHKHFWARAFALLKEKAAIHLETGGKHAGCWVLRLSDSEEFAGMEEPDKILVRSTGTVTYTGKDIAYQLWKFGLLDADFDYDPFRPRWDSGSVRTAEVPAAVREHTVWRTAYAGGAPDPPSFGHGDRVFNVIDVRQAYPQKVVREGLRALGHAREADRSIHFSYERVGLSAKAARELSERFGEEYRLSPEDEKKPFVEMSGRRGLGVKADDLVELLLERSRAEIAARRGGAEARGEGADAAERDARAIAIGALRYFLLKVGRNKVIAFDFDEALNFEGDTGPYLQYSLVRTDNIFRKLEEKGLPGSVDPGALPDDGWDDELWTIALEAASTPDVAQRAVDSLELAALARHAFGLAQAFNHFYHQQPILHEEDAAVRNRRLAIARIFRAEMSRLLELLGIPEPGRM
jgi:arginyl-tRNA synthetase